jgi:hypothetical protein
LEDGTFVTLLSLLDDVVWWVPNTASLAAFRAITVLPKGCSMELAVFVVVLIVAGAAIPGDSKIRFYR